VPGRAVTGCLACSLPVANQYLREHFLPPYYATFGRPPVDPTSAFVSVGACDLGRILCHEEERTVGRETQCASMASSPRSTSNPPMCVLSPGAQRAALSGVSPAAGASRPCVAKEAKSRANSTRLRLPPQRRLAPA
jgi:hypothetical protein